MFTFDPDACRARIARPGEAPPDGGPSGPIDGQLVCYYPCPRCSNPARALVYLGDAALAQEVAAQAQDVARHLGLLAAGNSRVEAKWPPGHRRASDRVL